ncbi:MAG: hypothetical protein QOK42_2775 [Frankiaceae bacterium]|nr:hypothetical protein [Frankiaceae bacterium]
MRRTAVLALTTALGLSLAAPALAGHGHGNGPKHKDKAATYYVGSAIRSINPTPEMLADNFYLGGFGLGSGKIGNAVDPGVYAQEPHLATGILNGGAPGYGVAVRALAIGDGRHTITLAQLDLQGYFSAYKQGPFGLVDIRNDAAAEIAKIAGTRKDLPTAGSILVDSNHSHGGPDTAGVWGGVPTTYLQLVHKQAVAAIVAAWTQMQPAHLSFGVSHAGVAGQQSQYPDDDPLLSNDFSDDPNNQVMDDELRIIRATDAETDAPLVTYLNFSAHPTVLGGGNRKVSADYTGPLSNMLGEDGSFGFAQVATLGRTHTAGPRCQTPGLSGDAAGVCAIDGYATRVMNHAREAIANAKPLTGKAVVGMHSFMLMDLAENAPIVSMSYAGTLIGAPVYRSVNAPWLTGDVLGTPTFSGRIGDVLLSGGPGEMYPQILDTVNKTVPARGHIDLGTAGDFLGYLIAPLEAYPEPVRHDILDGPPPPTVRACDFGVPSPVGCPAPIDSDNHLFNPSFTLGERITCSLLRGAGLVMGVGEQTYWSAYQRCAAFADDLARPADFDTTFPAQPDLSSVLTH